MRTITADRIMKNILITLLLIICKGFVFSQGIVVHGKEWHGAKFLDPDETFISRIGTNEVTIDGKIYRELTYQVEGSVFEGVGQFYREEGNKVYRLYEGEERVIYDFTLEVGDSIRVRNDKGEQFDFVPYRTVDTIIQNIIRRKLEMRGYPVDWTTSNPEKHVWIEGVGDTGFFFGFGEVYGNLQGAPIYCVREGHYIFGAGAFCPHFVLISNVEKEEVNEDFLRYEPISKQLYIDHDKVEKVDLYSITGAKVKSVPVNKSQNHLDLNDIDLQLCVVVIYNGKNFISKILRL